MTQANSGLPQRIDWPAWMLIAEHEIGVRELPGKADNPRIAEYQRATRLPETALRDETPWCAAFCCWVLEQVKLPNPKYALARRFLGYGDAVTAPQFGDIAVFSRGETSGHVAFFVRDIGGDIELLGGNQANSVRYSHYPKERLLGFRRPPSAANNV